jgi:hypothetical protein
VKRAFYFLAFLLATATCFIGCKTPETAVSILSPTPFSYDTLYVSGDSLYATVNYGGGCGEHKFILESAGFLLKSLPPKQPLRIVHRSDGDPCRALIKEEISFDLQSYRGTPRGVTVLIIENWNKNLSYSYE